MHIVSVKMPRAESELANSLVSNYNPKEVNRTYHDGGTIFQIDVYLDDTAAFELEDDLITFGFKPKMVDVIPEWEEIHFNKH